MDEKIFQRQITKQALADSFMVILSLVFTLIQDGKGSGGNSFSLEELKNLFTFHDTRCNTHDLIDCPCEGNGSIVEKELLIDQVEDEPEIGFTLASQMKEEPKKHKFDALHEFWHFDPQRWKTRDDDEEFMCDIIEDDVLRGVVQQQLNNDKEGVSYLFGVKRG